MTHGLVNTCLADLAGINTTKEVGRTRRRARRARRMSTALGLVLGVIFLLPTVLWAQASVDESFNVGDGPSEPVHAVALQADGKVLVGGQFTQVSGQPRVGVARFNADGTLDASFRADTNGTVFSLKVQSDGRILVGGGYSEIAGRPRNGLARLNPDGSLDDAFDPGLRGGAFSIVEQPDGKILAAGFFLRPDGEPGPHIARLNPDGSPDYSFNPGWGASSYIFSIALQADGKILAGGNFDSFDGQARNYVARLNPDGSLDTSFNPGMDADSNLPLGADGPVRSIVVRPDGRILMGGDFTHVGGQECSHLALLYADGWPDTSFHPHVFGPVYSVALQPDERILIGGSFLSVNGIGHGYAARLNAEGTYDRSFYLDPDNTVRSIVTSADGRILMGGDFTWFAGPNRHRVVRINPPVPTSNWDGTSEREFLPGASGFVRTAALQPDGMILVGGVFDSVGSEPRRHLARLTPDGTLDRSFDPGPDGVVRSITVLANARVLIGGEFSAVGGEPRNHIAMLNPDGTLNAGFRQGADAAVNCIVAQPDGNVLVGGEFTRVGAARHDFIARLRSDGTPDASFAPTPNGAVYSVAQQPDGRILVGGEFTWIAGQPRNHVARLNADGSLDASFNAQADGPVKSIVVQPDGRILVSIMDARTAPGVRHLARLNPDGSFDQSFNPSFGSGAPYTVQSIALQTDGRILIGGGDLNSTTPYLTDDMLRLNADGSLDDRYHATPSGSVAAIVQQADGRALVGGNFVNLNWTACYYFGRLFHDAGGLRQISVNSSGTAVTWSRGGTGPEVERVTFELSTDGLNYTPLGAGTRVSGGWRLGGLTLPGGRAIYVRARGFYSAGFLNGSGSVVESVRNLMLTGGPVPAEASVAQPPADASEPAD